MQYLKKYFTEGLIQMAILLSLCGVRVDVGLEPYLSPSWHEMILGPTSALTQTQFHNLRNRLEDGQSPHPKNVDLDGFFTARRLLGWVHSLDRLQVGNASIYIFLHIVIFNLNSDHKAPVGWTIRPKYDTNKFSRSSTGSSDRAGDVACPEGARTTPRGFSRPDLPTDESSCGGRKRPNCPS